MRVSGEKKKREKVGRKKESVISADNFPHRRLVLHPIDRIG